MNVKDAVADRVRELCQIYEIRPNELATRAGITPSTIYSLLDPRRRDVSVLTVKKICDGYHPGRLLFHTKIRCPRSGDRLAIPSLFHTKKPCHLSGLFFLELHILQS